MGNGLMDGKYWSIHVTPENDASFVSFETDFEYENYSEIIGKVVGFFKPKRFGFAVNVYGDGDAKMDVVDWKFDGFELCQRSRHVSSKCHAIEWVNYCKEDKSDRALRNAFCVEKNVRKSKA